MDWTKILFEKINKGEYKVIYSRLTDIEHNSAPGNIRTLVKSLPDSAFEFIDISDEAIKLAEQLLGRF